MSITAMKQALEALEDPIAFAKGHAAITALRTAIEAAGAAAERNKVASWMMTKGYATGHGDTTEDLLNELEWQVRESEREACARIAEEWQGPTKDREIHIAQAIRARGQE